jgi:CHASE2 domain-containing sensor protein
MLPEVVTLDQLSLVISQAAAPAFLLGAVASFLSVLVSHMSRIIDRSRAINDIPDDDVKKAAIKATLPQLRLRASLVNRAIYWAVASGISTCLLMIAAFGSAYFGIRHEPGAAILFTTSLGLFTFSLISFAREVKIAMTHTEFG